MGAVVTSKKCLDVELALASVVVHVADSAKHRSFVIKPVVNSSNAPHESHVAVGIIKIVAIIEVNRITQCVFAQYILKKPLILSSFIS
jgi:hypothetical protein